MIERMFASEFWELILGRAYFWGGGRGGLLLEFYSIFFNRRLALFVKILRTQGTYIELPLSSLTFNFNMLTEEVLENQ